MTVWYHQSTILKCKIALRMAGLIAVCVAFITTLFLSSATYAAPGINQTLSFQGRLLTGTGGAVTDGYYNIQFKIYKGGTDSGGGTEQWFESYVNNNTNAGVSVKNGYFSVNLGSKNAFANLVDWNDDTLYLSMNIAGNSPSCSNFTSCSPDGEMTPMKRITSVPFAINSAQLGGRTADGFIQNSTSPQTANFNITGTGTAANLQASSLDTASAGALTLGGANASSITMADDVTVAAGKSLTLAGGTTASRPASPSEGTLWFDTDLKKLVIYADSKWTPLGSGSKTATKIVAASNSPADIKNSADYVADGTGDQTEINAALTAAAGGKVYLAEGTYTINGGISVPNNTTLAGTGPGTVITIPNSLNTTINAITNTTGSGNGTGITIRDLKLDGNRATQTTGTMEGISLSGVGSGSGSSAVTGATIMNVQLVNWKSAGARLTTASHSTVQNVVAQNNAIGLAAATGSYNTFTNNQARGNTNGINLTGTSHSVISNNIVQGNTTVGIDFGNTSPYNTITNNTVQGNGGTGINFGASSTLNNLTGNTISDNTISGINISYASNNTITNSRVSGNGEHGINLNFANATTISGNTLSDNGGTGSNSAIYLLSTDNATIASNTITDSSMPNPNYAIEIANADSDTNTLSGNSLGGGTINDLGTGTIYINQLDENGTLINKTNGGVGIQTSTNTSTAFQVQDAAGSSALTVNTTNNSVLVAGTLDTTTGTTLAIGKTMATAITLGSTSSNVLTTVNGRALVKSTAGNNSTTAFQVQNASSTALLTADTTNMQVIIGSGGNTITLSANGITRTGTARNEKKITLTAEYTGAVLDAGNPGSNNGTMTSSVDLTSRMNYYKWTTSQSTNQNYDVVVQVPLPNDFDGWTANPLAVSTYTNDTTNGTITLEARDSTGTIRCNFVNVTPGSINAWTTNNSACTLGTGTYTAGDYITLRLRMQSPNGGDVRIGNISLNYLSKY